MGRPSPALARAVALLVCGMAFLALPPPHRAVAAPDGSPWRRPVPGAVVRPFVEPAHAYAPGHRGIDFVAAPGANVLAAGRGTVAFAGDVGGSLHVVVLHRSGLRTSYSFLAEVLVATGDPVETGAVIGRSGGTDPAGMHGTGVLHFGLRVGERYVDPLQLFRPRDLSELVRLVPVDGDPGVGSSWAHPPVDERAALRADLSDPAARAEVGDGVDDGCDSGIPLVGSAVDAVCDAGKWLASGTRQALRAGLSLLEDAGRKGRALARRLGREVEGLLDELGQVATAARRQLLDTPIGRVLVDLVEIGERFLDWTHRECARDAPPADGAGGSGHAVMAVAGIGSSSSGADQRSFGLDVAALGYEADEVHWYSYAVDGGAYTAAETEQDLRLAAKRLAEQLRAMDAREPGREIDLIAHSQGGIVVEQFLRFEYDASDPTFPPIGTVVTLASPHQGAPLATSLGVLREHRKTRRAVDVLDRVLPGPDADATSVRQLAEDSPFMQRLRAAPMPEHIELTTVGGTDDLIVPANRIHVPGATEVVVAVDGLNDHSAIHHDDRALQVVRSALEGRPPPCTSFLEGVRAAVEPVLISRVESDLGDFLTTYLEVGR
ncbi:MAG: hypothetical protein AMXMBFR46_11460 [Acidimicrobiia bacterium]